MTQGNREVILERKQAVVLFAGGVIALILVFALGVLFGRNMANRGTPKEQSQVAMKGLEPEKPKPVPSSTAEAAKPQTGDAAIKQKIDQQKPPEPSKPAKGETVTKGKVEKPIGKETKPETKEIAKAPQPGTATAVKPVETKKPETKPAPAQPSSAPIAPAKPVTAPLATAKPVTAPTTAATPAKPAEPKPGTTKPVETKPATKPEPAKPATTPAVSKGGFAIQVAAYPDKGTADELVGRLQANKWPAHLTTTAVPGKGTYYRVNLGPYSSRDQASKALSIFKSKEPKHKDSFVRATE